MYNIKVNKDGSYRDYYGYTVICMTKDNLSFILQNKTRNIYLRYEL